MRLSALEVRVPTNKSTNGLPAGKDTRQTLTSFARCVPKEDFVVIRLMHRQVIHNSGVPESTARSALKVGLPVAQALCSVIGVPPENTNHLAPQALQMLTTQLPRTDQGAGSARTAPKGGTRRTRRAKSAPTAPRESSLQFSPLRQTRARIVQMADTPQ